MSARPYFDFRQHRESPEPLPEVVAETPQERLCAGGYPVVGVNLCDNIECWRCANEAQYITSLERLPKLNPYG